MDVFVGDADDPADTTDTLSFSQPSAHNVAVDADRCDARAAVELESVVLMPG